MGLRKRINIIDQRSRKNCLIDTIGITHSGPKRIGIFGWDSEKTGITAQGSRKVIIIDIIGITDSGPRKIGIIVWGSRNWYNCLGLEEKYHI